MPKPLTEEQKSATMDVMYKKGLKLIRTKKLKNITVEEITSAAGIAKGTFYAYYKSKEEFLYQLLNRFETELMEKVATAAHSESTLKGKVLHIFKDIYLAEDSIAFSLDTEDVDWLLGKLPAYITAQNKTSQNNFLVMFLELGIQPCKCTSSTIHYLADCLRHISSLQFPACEDAGKQEAIDILVNSIASYVCKLAEDD